MFQNYIHLDLYFNDITAHFISCYKSPSLHNTEFIDFLDATISDIDLKEPIFILGDINMDLKSDSGKPLQKLINDYNITNFIKESTRVMCI